MYEYFKQSFDFLHRRFSLLAHNFVAHTSAAKLIICLVIPIILWIIPLEWFHLTGLNIAQHRTIVIFAFAAIFWIMEPIPIFATSITVILLELLLLSNSGIKWVMPDVKDETFGVVLNYKDIISTFASPIIILFLGGFFLAIAAAKYQMDAAMAKTFIKPFGVKPKWVMLGIMSITAIFSMFMSNTATTAMMLSILVPVLASLDDNDKGRIGFVLCVPVAANVGGLGTPIGTPPNAIAMKYLTGDNMITFSQWMVIGIPFVIILLLIGWVILLNAFPTITKEIHLDINPTVQNKQKTFIIYATFAVTVLLWLTDFWHGINAYTIALVPVASFLCLGVITKDDLKNISWDVLWLVSGGIALGLALSDTGLANIIVENIPFESLPVTLIFLLTAIAGLLIANFMSNTATANLLIPIIAVLGSSLATLDNFGGEKTLLLSTTLAISLGMCLPISTPPNALAYSTGLISTKNMAIMGTAMGIIGLLLVFIILFIDNQLGII